MTYITHGVQPGIVTPELTLTTTITNDFKSGVSVPVDFIACGGAA